LNKRSTVPKAARTARPQQAAQSSNGGEAARLAQSIEAMRAPRPVGPSACFYHNLCGRAAEIEVSGRSVCRICANTNLRGREYRLRHPRQRPPYKNEYDAAVALDMHESSGAGRFARGPSLFPRD
jgi:hypothetical protein